MPIEQLQQLQGLNQRYAALLEEYLALSHLNENPQQRTVLAERMNNALAEGLQIIRNIQESYTEHHPANLASSI